MPKRGRAPRPTPLGPGRIVGSHMPGSLRRLARPGIEPVGEVASIDAVLDRVRLTVAPLRNGAGLKGKVIESLAAGVPCVGTGIAFEGIALPAALAGCLADTPEAIAAALVRLGRDAAAHAAAAEAGRRLAIAAYGEAAVDAAMRDAAAPVLRRWSELTANAPAA